jgi:hypothetical protein
LSAFEHPGIETGCRVLDFLELIYFLVFPTTHYFVLGLIIKTFVIPINKCILVPFDKLFQPLKFGSIGGTEPVCVRLLRARCEDSSRRGSPYMSVSACAKISNDSNSSGLESSGFWAALRRG